jgi:hypothetical protein
LTINPIQTKDISWSIGVNFTKIDNYVDELAPGVQSIFLGGFLTPQVRAAIGQKFPVIYGGSFKKDSKGRTLVDEDPTSWSYGMPLYSGIDTIIGKVAPDFTVGFNTSFRFKNLTLSATVDWKKGGQMYSGSNGLYNLYGVSKKTEDRTTPFIYPGYLADGTPNNISRGGPNDPDAYQDFYTAANDVDEAYIYNTSFVKLRELALSYQLPKFSGMQFNVSLFARNILLWSEMPNLDPESSQGNTNMGGSFERFSVPQTSSYGMSLSLIF